MNEVLILYLQHLFDSGKPLWVGKHAVLAVQTLFRPLKGKLRSAWDSIAAWRLQRPVSSRVPMRIEIMTALCHYSALAACKLDQARSALWMSFATVVRVGFFGLLRPKELFALTPSVIRLPTKVSFPSARVATITVVDPKNKGALGRVQVRIIRDPSCIAWLCWLCRGLPPGHRLWPGSRALFCKMLKTALDFLDLGNLKLSPGSLRAGGATHLLETGVAVANIKFMGGWKSEHSLAAYLQEAEAAATLLTLSDTAATRLELILTQVNFAMWPPAQPFNVFL
jgi:hypothetical protein